MNSRDHSPSAEMNYLQSRGNKAQVLSCCLSELSTVHSAVKQVHKTMRCTTSVLLSACSPIPASRTMSLGRRAGHTPSYIVTLKLPWGALPKLLNLTPKQEGGLGNAFIMPIFPACPPLQCNWFFRSGL